MVRLKGRGGSGERKAAESWYTPGARAVSLAITFDSGWRAWQENKELKIKKDALGQMVILPEGRGEIRMKYLGDIWGQSLGLGIALAALIGMKNMLL